MKATTKVTKAARCLMGINRLNAAPSEDAEGRQGGKDAPGRVGGHCASSVRFLRRTYQQTRLVLTQHNLSAPDSDEEDSDSEDSLREPDEDEDHADVPVERPTSKASRQTSKSALKAKAPSRKEALWGKVQAMFEGTRLAILHRNKVLDKVLTTVKATVEQHNSVKRMKETVTNAVDGQVLSSLGLDPDLVEMFREIMQDSAQYQTLDHVTFSRNLLQVVLGEEVEAQDQAYFELQDSLLDASQEGAGDEQREQELESLMWAILTKVDDLKDAVARARERGLEIALSDAEANLDEHVQRSIKQELPQSPESPPQPQDRTPTPIGQTPPAPALVVELPPMPLEMACEAPGPHAPNTEHVATPDEDKDIVIAPVEPPPSYECQEVPDRHSPAEQPPSSRLQGPRPKELPAAKPRRQLPEPAPRERKVRTETALPVFPQLEKEPLHQHAVTMDSFFEASQTRDVELPIRRHVETANGLMMVVGQAQLPMPPKRPRDGSDGRGKQRFPVMPMHRVAEEAPVRPPGTPAAPSFAGKLESSWSFSKNQGSGRFDYALAPLPVSQIVRNPVIPDKPQQKRRGRTPPSNASSTIDWFPLPSIPGTLEDDF